MKFVVFALFYSSLLISANASGETVFPTLTGPYLGQKTPELTAELFAPNIVSINGRYEYGIAFSPRLDEVYFSTQEPGATASIYSSKMKGGIWQPLEKMTLTQGEKAGEMEPFVSHDSSKLYFTAYNKDFTDTKIWVSHRVDGTWSKAEKLNSPINDAEVFNATLAKNGDLFYTDIFKSKTFYSTIKNGKYPKTEEVKIGNNMHPFISPEQDYLLVDAAAKDKSRKDKDIYVHFKNNDGTWSKPINLGDAVNSKYYETVPTVTPDGKYLFFSRYNEGDNNEISNFYWVSTEVIEKLRPNKN